MTLPTVVMQAASGLTVPSIIHLPDGSTVTPNASNQITVATSFISVLLAAGWQVVVSSGTTHVP